MLASPRQSIPAIFLLTVVGAGLAPVLPASGANLQTTAYVMVGTPFSVSGGDDVVRLKALTSGVGLGQQPNGNTNAVLSAQGVKTLRLINVDVAGTFDGDTFVATSFSGLDSQLAICKAVGAIPHVVMVNKLPQQLRQIVQEGSKTVTYGPNDGISPETSWAKLQSYCRVFFKHVHDYDPAFVDARFEVGNEADIGGSFIEYDPGNTFPANGSTELFNGYYKLYKNVAQAANDYAAGPGGRPVRLGGGSFTSYSIKFGTLVSTTGKSWPRNFMEKCKADGTKFDFGSFHYYGNISSLNGEYSAAYDSFAKMMEAMQAVRDVSQPGVPILVTEWGADYHIDDSGTHQNFNNANHIGAAWGACFLDTMLKQKVDGALLLLTTDGSYYDAQNVLQNNWGWPALFVSPTVVGGRALPKAPGNLFTMISWLKGSRVRTDKYDATPVQTFSSVDPDSKTVTVMLRNYNFQMSELGVGTEKSQTYDANVVVTGGIASFLASPYAKVRVWSISQTSGNIYELYRTGQAWKDGQGNLVESNAVVAVNADDSVRYSLAMPPSSVSFLEISSANPGAPRALEITPKDGGTNIAWVDDSSDESGFELERRVANGSWMRLSVTDSNVTGLIDDSVLPGVIYEYRLRSINAYGHSAWVTANSLTTADAGTVERAVYSADGLVVHASDSGPDNAYVPAGLTYSPQATPFVAGQTLSSTIRNNATLWMGMKISVGATPLIVRELGRWVLSGNTAVHTVKLMTAAGANVAGGAVSVATNGAPAGFKYVSLPAPITLAANTDYYLVSNETSGGDQWYEGNTALSFDPDVATTRTAFTGNNGANWTHYNYNCSYGPVSFTYSKAIPFVTNQALASASNNLTAWMGMKITVGDSPIVVRELGRWVRSGNTASHTVKLVHASGVDIPFASVSVDTAGAPVGFKYAALAIPVTLAPRTSYYLVSQETNGGDQWHQGGSLLTYDSRVAVTQAAYTPNNGTNWWLYNANASFGPTSFKYTLDAIPFLTGHNLTTLRNNYTGWLGMEIKVGARDLSVFELGRWVAPGNTGNHTVKLVHAGTGAEVASANVSTAGAPAGQFKYSSLGVPVKLTANTTYFVLSQETDGGDQWYDFSRPAVGTATGYQSWLLRNGLPMDASGMGSATATPVGDGLPNLVKYALDLPPSISGNGGRLDFGEFAENGGRYLTLVYTRPEPAPSGITYRVESSSDLVNWTTTGLVEVGGTVGMGLRTIVTRNASPLGGTEKHFMRLRISQP